MSGRAEAPGCVLAPWCPILPAASASRRQGTLPAGCRQAAQCVCQRVCESPERVGGSPRLRFGTVVPNPARGVSNALRGYFTRRLPPGGSMCLSTRLRIP
jgi:hypothetical protein